ncbi:MAG: CBS domain-containing protein [Rhodospirillaceae bacterium]
MPNRLLIPDVINAQTLPTVAPGQMVVTAAKSMAAGGAGATIITTDGTVEGEIIGIFTENDLNNRVVAAGRDPAHTLVGEVMTQKPYALGPNATAKDALQFMNRHHCTHLPVVYNGRLVGLASIKDLFVVINQQLEDDIAEVEDFVFGNAYSLRPTSGSEAPTSEILYN